MSSSAFLKFKIEQQVIANRAMRVKCARLRPSVWLCWQWTERFRCPSLTSGCCADMRCEVSATRRVCRSVSLCRHLGTSCPWHFPREICSRTLLLASRRSSLLFSHPPVLLYTSLILLLSWSLFSLHSTLRLYRSMIKPTYLFQF